MKNTEWKASARSMVQLQCPTRPAGTIRTLSKIRKLCCGHIRRSFNKLKHDPCKNISWKKNVLYVGETWGAVMCSAVPIIAEWDVRQHGVWRCNPFEGKPFAQIVIRLYVVAFHKSLLRLPVLATNTWVSAPHANVRNWRYALMMSLRHKMDTCNARRVCIIHHGNLWSNCFCTW